jgi:APA family basic amino acid/polyamine antiporter
MVGFMARLEKSISLPQAVFYCVGVIIGAGIYTLIGIAAGITGPALWVSFVIAGLIASLTAFSYAKLTHLFPKEAAESVYVLNSFKRKDLAFFVGFLSLITCLFSVAAVSWGFAAYFKFFFAFDPLIVCIGVIVLLSIINFMGVQKSIIVNNTMAFLTIIGLLLIIIFGLRFVGSVDLLTGFNGQHIWENSFSLIPSLFSAAALIFFAYLGFEELANVTEEMKNPKINAPKAILFSLLIATVLYVSISIVSVSVISPSELANAANPNIPLTKGPLALVAEKAISPGFGFWLSIFALCATSSTIIALLNVASRILYGMSTEGLMPKIFSRVNPKTHTPFVAILFVLIIAICFTFVENIELLGNLTTVGTFLLFFSVNASVVVLSYKTHKRISWLALIGAAFCFFMFLTQYWENINFFGARVPLIIVATLVFCLAFPIYWAFSRKRKSK